MENKILTLFFSEKIVQRVLVYKKNYMYRALVVLFGTLLFFLISNNFLYSIVLFFVIEMYFVDIFIDRSMPPAFLMITEKTSENHRKVIFIFVNMISIFTVFLCVIYM